MYDTCYYFYRLPSTQNSLEMNDYCLKKNMTTPDFPTFNNLFIMKFLSFIFLSDFQSGNYKNTIEYLS